VGGALGASLLDLECEPDDPGSLDSFDDVDLQLALGKSGLAGSSWRQHDFSTSEFKRSFARRVMDDNSLGFRSVQVSPVDGKRGADTTWVISRFNVERARVAFPVGVASLAFHNASGAPSAWNAICDGLAGMGGRIDLPTGDWYRLDMDLRVITEDSF
jgi:hypothetical protein